MVFKVKEVAQRLSCSVDNVYQLIYSGRLPAVNIARKPGESRATYRVPEKALEEFLAQGAA